MKFSEVYSRLNDEQKQAVDTIEGPLLVLAGPGTGKTQLLSARVANILKKTDTLPENILCLTFTESAARNMRERLSSMIGDAAYDVHMSTYHSFGSDIIKAFPQYFATTQIETGEETRLEKPIDDLTKTSLVSSVLANLPFDDPLRSANYYVKSVSGTISELKRGLVSPTQLRDTAAQNLATIAATSSAIHEVFSPVGRIPAIKKALPLFHLLGQALTDHQGELVRLAHNDLLNALQQAEENNKTTPLTAFKKQWLHKSEEGVWQLAGTDASLKMASLANIYEAYQTLLASKGYYDFDDMILRVIEAIQNQPELRYELQESYQYILLDEFQDTNASQFALVQELASNPVNEGRPNVMAVGDDDQAIYAFQGADIGNMQAFLHAFRDVTVINLKQNYRSHKDVLHVAHNIADQIESRLHYSMEGISKTLQAASTKLPAQAAIERHEFSAQAGEYAWVSQKIEQLQKSGVPLHDIAVLAPKHALLEKLVPFLNSKQLPVAYEKRENILQTKLVLSLRYMAQLVVALQHNDTKKADELFPVVLSLEFWQIPVEAIWQVNWRIAKEKQLSWAEAALHNEQLAQSVRYFLRLGLLAATEPLEYMLDYFMGTMPLIYGDESYISPFKSFYFTPKRRSEHANTYVEGLSHVSVIRSKLRDYQNGQDQLVTLQDFLAFIALYDAAEEPLINSHPYAQATEAVQLLTVYKAKGLEFSHVFLLCMHDDVWGKKARSNSNKLSLPKNLQHIRYQGSSEDELKRLLFVAITRAKCGLYVTSHAANDSGKPTEYVKYLRETKEEQTLITGVLPVAYQQQVQPAEGDNVVPQEAVELLWQQRHIYLEPSLDGLLKDRLANYRMSPTHVNTFIDTEYGGPEAFLLRTLLRFPQAPTPDSEFGNAVHATLDWYQKQLHVGNKPSSKELLHIFDQDISRRYIAASDLGYFKTKGHHALTAYIHARHDMFSEPAVSEVDFSREGVVIANTVLLSGKIDRLEVNKQTKTITVVDYKTGKGVTTWPKELKYLKYRHQLYMYKLLVEGSHSYKGYTVTAGRLEFVEPDKNGNILPPLHLTFEDEQVREVTQLILAVWQHIQSLQFSDISEFSADYKGALAFMQQLLDSSKL